MPRGGHLGVVDVGVQKSYLAPTALGAGGTATIWTCPGGQRIRLKRIQISVNAPTRITLRWAAASFESYYMPANGTIIANFRGCNEEGGVGENLTLHSSAAATVTAKASGDTY